MPIPKAISNKLLRRKSVVGLVACNRDPEISFQALLVDFPAILFCRCSAMATATASPNKEPLPRVSSPLKNLCISDDAPDSPGSPGPIYNGVNNFSELKEIYRGRHSIVWNCKCKRSGGPIVLKAYVKAKMQVRHFQQVKREIKLMQEISFCRCVGYLGSFEDNRNIYIVQENCSKGDLFKRVLRAGGILPERVIINEVILPLLYTLDHLHLKKVIHRDIKPENIFFAADGTLRLGDFGLSINCVQERPKSRVGTLDYMAPEVISLPTHDERIRLEAESQVKDVTYYDSKVDIWACGILAYELMVGRPPFEVEEERETALRIMYANDIEFPCYVSKTAQDFVLTTLKKKAVDRPDAKEALSHKWLQPHLGSFLEKFPEVVKPHRSALAKQKSMLKARFSEQPVTGVIPSQENGGSPERPLSPGSPVEFSTPPRLPPITAAQGQAASQKSKLKRTLSLGVVKAKMMFGGMQQRGKDPVESPDELSVDPSGLSEVGASGSTSVSTDQRPINVPRAPKNKPKRTVTMGAGNQMKNLDVVLAVDEMDNLRKLGESGPGGSGRTPGIKNRIVSYLNGHNGQT